MSDALNAELGRIGALALDGPEADEAMRALGGLADAIEHDLASELDSRSTVTGARDDADPDLASAESGAEHEPDDAPGRRAERT